MKEAGQPFVKEAAMSKLYTSQVRAGQGGQLGWNKSVILYVCTGCVRIGVLGFRLLTDLVGSPGNGTPMLIGVT